MPAVNPTATKKENSNKSLGNEFKIKLNWVIWTLCSSGLLSSDKHSEFIYFTREINLLFWIFYRFGINFREIDDLDAKLTSGIFNNYLLYFKDTEKIHGLPQEISKKVGSNQRLWGDWY